MWFGDKWSLCWSPKDILFGDIPCQWHYCLVIFLNSDNIVWWFSLSVYQLLVIFLVSDSIVWWFFLSVTILFGDLRCQCTNYWWFSLSVTVLFGDIPCQCTNSFVTRSKCWTSTSSVSKPLPPPLSQLLPQIPIQFCFSDLYLYTDHFYVDLCVNHPDNRGI